MTTRMTYLPQHPSLQGLVDAIYVYRCDQPFRQRWAGALLPQLTWQIQGAFAWRARGGEAQPIGRAAILGPASAAMQLETHGPMVVIGLGLFPEGWAALLPMAAGTMVDRVAALHDVWGDDADLPLAGSAADDDATLAGRIDALLCNRLRDALPVDPRIATITAWANGKDHDIDALAASLQVSRRHLDRITTAACGLPPSVLANKQKIMRMAAALAIGMDNRRAVWTEEFADQAHFNRNFKRFIGVTPTRFLQADDVLVRDVMQARFAIASHHPLGLSTEAAVPV